MKVYTPITKFRRSADCRKFWEVKEDDKGILSCNCPIWIYNKREDRTCKHIDQVLCKV